VIRIEHIPVDERSGRQEGESLTPTLSRGERGKEEPLTPSLSRGERGKEESLSRGERGSVALILLDRPGKRNALTPDMLHNIADAADLVHAGPGKARAVVLAGEGPVFCAGFDLALCRDDQEAMADLLSRLSRAIRSLRRLPVPVVVAAHGGAIAGGCALLGGADVVVADERAKFGYPVVRLGVSPAVTAPALRQAIGEGAARRRLLDPGLIDGREAHRIGLAHDLVPLPEDVRARAIETARTLAAKPHHSIVATKRWLNELDGSYDDEAFDAALRASLRLAGGEEERRRLAAMWSKE